MALGSNINNGPKKNTPIKSVSSDTVEEITEVVEEIVLASIAEDILIEEEDAQIDERVQIIAFPVGDEYYALSIDVIKEVVLMPNVSIIPQAPYYVIGAANIRGHVMAIIDLKKRFKLKDGDQSDQEHKNYALVLKHEEYSVAIAVERVPDTIIVNKSEIDHTGDIITNTSVEEDFIKGVIKQEEKMIFLIDIIEMLSSDELLKDAKSTKQ